MRYMMMIYSRETPEGVSPGEVENLKMSHWAVMQDSKAQGKLVAVEGLKPTTTATTVRKQDGAFVTLDGPFAETKEQLAGFYILDCQDLDEAIAWARRIPTLCKGQEGCIEIRPVAELSRRP